jgi:hypothetical protein
MNTYRNKYIALREVLAYYTRSGEYHRINLLVFNNPPASVALEDFPLAFVSFVETTEKMH